MRAGGLRVTSAGGMLYLALVAFGGTVYGMVFQGVQSQVGFDAAVDVTISLFRVLALLVVGPFLAGIGRDFVKTAIALRRARLAAAGLDPLGGPEVPPVAAGHFRRSEGVSGE